MRPRRAVRVSAVFLAVLVLPGSADAAASCLFDCALTSADGVDAIQTACVAYAGRIDKHEEKFERCVDVCRLRGTSPNSAGHCGGTRECLERCRGLRTAWSRRAAARARRAIRASCSPIVSPCKLSRSTVRSACELLRTAASSALASTEPDPDAATIVRQASAEDDGACRPACVADKLKICYADCDDACGDDRQARRFCRGACRNRGCAAIVALCGCEPEVDCEPSKSTTSTTTSSPASTTVTVTTTTLAP
jgi:hypothetical protein